MVEKNRTMPEDKLANPQQPPGGSLGKAASFR
jgi:hypothetical protein